LASLALPKAIQYIDKALQQMTESEALELCNQFIDYASDLESRLFPE
jgi:lipase chaperone LimK